MRRLLVPDLVPDPWCALVLECMTAHWSGVLGRTHSQPIGQETVAWQSAARDYAIKRACG